MISVFSIFFVAWSMITAHLNLIVMVWSMIIPIFVPSSVCVGLWLCRCLVWFALLDKHPFLALHYPFSTESPKKRWEICRMIKCSGEAEFAFFIRGSLVYYLSLSCSQCQNKSFAEMHVKSVIFVLLIEIVILFNATQAGKYRAGQVSILGIRYA